ITDSDSVERVSRSIGGKVDILINTASYERDGGVLRNRDMNKARDALDIHCLGLMRLAQHFGPGMAARAADGVNSAVACETMPSSPNHLNLPAPSTRSASQAAAWTVAHCLRNEFLQSGVRVMNVFSRPIDHDWEQLTPPPRVNPKALA